MNRLWTSGLGLGLLPGAPGTWGSLLPAVVFMTAGILFGPAAAIWAMAVLLGAGCVVSVVCSPSVIAQTGRTDPGQIVSDEVAGQALALLLAQLIAPLDFCWMSAFLFGLFRFFDIVKPWPCKKLEKLPAGWGILADDLAAGLWAAGIWIAGRTLAYWNGLPQEEAAITTASTILLGAVQGLTEFLPVSSEGHLVLFQHLLPGMDAENPQMIVFDLALHLGTVLSILVVFRKTITRFFAGLVSAFKSGLKPIELVQKKAPVRLAILGIVATVATGVLYILFDDLLESGRGMFGLGFWWVVSALFLFGADFRKGHIGLKQFGFGAAVLIGLAQGLAILPSMSRSGSTICTAILLGIRPRWAVEFSFLISIPAILGGAAIKAIQHIEYLHNGNFPLIPTLAGMIASCIVGIFALKILIAVSRKRNLKIFALYCLILAMMTFVSLL